MQTHLTQNLHNSEWCVRRCQYRWWFRFQKISFGTPCIPYNSAKVPSIIWTFIHAWKANLANTALIFHSLAQHFHSEFVVHVVLVYPVDSSHAASFVLLDQKGSHNTQSCKRSRHTVFWIEASIFPGLHPFLNIILQFHTKIQTLIHPSTLLELQIFVLLWCYMV